MKKTVALFVLAALLLALTACGGDAGSSQSPESPAQTQSTPPVQTSDGGQSGELLPVTMTDPSGSEITLPEQIDSIIVLAPSLAETVVALGLGDKIVGYDTQSIGVAGLPEGVPTFDIMTPDVEQLAATAPDVMLVSSMSLYDQEAPYQPLIDAGVCVICVPTSVSIENVRTDIQFLADALGVPEEGKTVLAQFNAALDELADLAASVPQEERRSVYFEISPAPYLYSTGGNTYLNEMIEWVGGVNVLADQEGWIGVEGESIVAANPDVIFTNVNYMDAPVDEILSRDGWAGVTAVANGYVYYIDNMSSSLPNQNIVAAMEQMIQALYPDCCAAQ